MTKHFEKTTQSSARALAFAMLIMVACAASCLFAAPAYAENIQLNAPTTVSDDITRLHVNKLDANTHEFVKGATMAIIVEETGEVVDSWVTGNATHENEKGLDVNVVYILRELEAPEGYGKVQDVRFTVNETEGTGITILSKGDDAELTGSYKLALYDARLTAQTETVVTRANQTSSQSTSTTVAPKTGDETPLSRVMWLVGFGLLVIVFLQIWKGRLKD